MLNIKSKDLSRSVTLQVVNFLELVGEAMGVEKPDLFKQWKIMQEIDRILAEVAAQAAAAGAGLGKRPRSAPRQYAGRTTSAHRFSRQAAA